MVHLCGTSFLHTATVKEGFQTSRYVSKKIENRDLNRCLCASIYSSILHINQKAKATQVSINRWVDKQTELLFSHSKD